MPAAIAHLVTLIETYHTLKSGNESIFETEPVKKNELRIKGGIGKSDKGISQYAYLGALGPDIPYAHSEIYFAADLFHYNRASTFAIKLIDYARGKGVGSLSGNRMMAFILGFISHIAADAVCHPYVNTIAGAFWNQLLAPRIDYMATNLWGLGPLLGMGLKKKDATMHHIAETHQDSWLARRYFGLKELSDGSWSDFIDDLSFGLVDPCAKRDVQELFRDICSCFEEVYGRRLDEESLWDAGDNIFESLDLGYDTASFPVPDIPSENLVYYKHRGQSYYYYLGKAFTLSKALCHFAIDYYHKGSENEKNTLKMYLKDWNLDMGYCINVYALPKNSNKIESIHIRFEHSWCHNFGLYDLVI